MGLILEQEKANLKADLLPWHPPLCQHLLFFYHFLNFPWLEGLTPLRPPAQLYEQKAEVKE